MKKLVYIIGLSLCLNLISGCVMIAGGAVIASAAYVAYNHRSLTQAHQDQALQQTIVKKLNSNPSINQPNTYIYVSVFYGQVLLTGQVPNNQIKQLADSVAKDTRGTTILYNQLIIAGASSELTRMSDSWLSTKVKMHLLGVKDLKTSQIMIVVNNGIVYILGHNLSAPQTRWAANAASKVSGVQKVVVCQPKNSN